MKYVFVILVSLGIRYLAGYSHTTWQWWAMFIPAVIIITEVFWRIAWSPKRCKDCTGYKRDTFGIYCGFRLYSLGQWDPTESERCSHYHRKRYKFWRPK